MTREMHPQRWGDPARAQALPDQARGLVELAFGVRESPAVEVVSLPAVRVAGTLLDRLAEVVGPDHVSVADGDRRARTRGRSTPDLLRARAGDLEDAPDAVVRPGSHEEVQALLELATRERFAVVPYGGGTAVTGGLVARRDGLTGVVCLDLRRLDHVVGIDTESMTATLEPGLLGPELDRELGRHGLVLGHFPQSFEWASVGGFAATRSSGQSSAGYGRFDAMVVGLRVATPTGAVELGVAPASAAGPDLRQVFLGSEGAFGVITAVTVRVRPRPEATVYEGWRWGSFDAGSEAMRALAQRGPLATVVRLSDETETSINLADPTAIGSEAEAGCLMVVGHEGTADRVAARRAEATELLASLGGEPLGEGPGRSWVEGRFDAPYLRDSLLDVGVLVETLETATFWSRRREVYDAVKGALQEALPGALVLCHVSHVYETGCSLYFTVAAPGDGDVLDRWAAAKAAATDAMVAHGATITHHHAVGTDHRPWLAREIGDVGVRVLRAIKAELDPAGVMNPGVLVP